MGQADRQHGVENVGGIEGRFSLVRIVCSLSTIAVLAKIFGFAEKCVIAHFFGTSDTADVYFASTGIILAIIWLVRELMAPSLLPVLAGSLSKSASASGHLFRRVFLWAAVFLGITAVLLASFPGPVTTVLVPGFSESKQQMMMNSNLLRMLAPATFFLGLGMVTYTTLNARKSFLKAACPETALKLFIVIGLIVLVPVLGIYALALAMGLGALGCVLVQLYFIPESKFLFKRGENADDDGLFGKVLLLMGPLVVGVAFSRISGLVDNGLASTCPEGHLSYLNYSKKLIDAMLFIGPVVMVTVVYSHLSHLASEKDYAGFKHLTVKAFRLIVYLSVPVACMLIGLRLPLIRCLFQRGEFTEVSTLGTSKAFMIYALGVTTFSLETLLVHSFFALSDTKTPVIFGILCVVLDIGLAIALLNPLGYLGIACAFVISKTTKIVILTIILHKRLKGLFEPGILIFLVKLAVTTSAVWSALKLLLGIENSDSFLHTAAFHLMLPGLGGMAAFVFCSYFLRIDEFKAFISLLRNRKTAVNRLCEDAE